MYKSFSSCNCLYLLPAAEAPITYREAPPVAAIKTKFGICDANKFALHSTASPNPPILPNSTGLLTLLVILSSCHLSNLSPNLVQLLDVVVILLPAIFFVSFSSAKTQPKGELFRKALCM